MLSAVQAALEGLLSPQRHVICAVSGGADSVALLYCLYESRQKFGLQLEAAHFNHHLRGAASDEDEAFVRALCRQLDIPLHTGGAAVRDFAAARKLGLEEAARMLRYEFFAALPGQIATAHTANDNLETILMNLLRGAGSRGLAGIPPVRGQIIRPMLTVSREQVLAYLRAHALCWREDASNASDAFRRNRLRHHIVPLLLQENPNLLETVSVQSRLLLEEDAYLSQLAGAQEKAARRGGGWSLVALRALPDAPLRRTLKCLLPPQCGARATEQVLQLVRDARPNGQTELPGGLHARKRYGLLQIVPPAGPEEAFCLQLPIPGQATLPNGGLLRASWQAPQKAQGLLLCLQLPEGVRSLTARSRKPGDSMLCSCGHRSLKKWMIDRKIPAEQRARLPVLTDGAQILGVFRLGVSAACRPDAQAHVLFIEWIDTI